MTSPRLERALIALPALAALAVIGWAMVAARCSEAHDADLLERARAAATDGERCRAMNQLCLRGYWDARPTEQLNAFLEDAPEGVQAFVRAAHPSLLGARAVPGATGPGC